jgi:hypothetical protein
MMLEYQRFTAVLLLIYGSLFLSGVYYCLSLFWCAIARMSELELENWQEWKRNMLVQVYRDNAMMKTAVYKWVTCFSEGRVSLTKRDWDDQQRELKKTLQKFVKLCVKIVS